MDASHAADVTDGPATTLQRDPLDVGFLPAECPGTGGAGATRTSELLIERLSQYHDLTVYVASQATAEPSRLPASERVEYVLHDDLPSLPHPLRTKLDAMADERDALASHDLVHAYSPAFVPVLADLPVPTVSTLNSYLPVCPKGDFRYHDGSKCDGPGTAKCLDCIARSNLNASQDVADSLRAAYSAVGKVGFVGDAMEAADEVTAYQALTPHIEDDYAALGFPEGRITVVPHFYDEAFRRPDAGGSGDGEVELLYVGRLKENKGPQVLVRALPLIQARGYDVTVRVAGDGPTADALQQTAYQIGVDDAVEWLGYVDHADLPPLYESADVFVFPGLLDEPFGRVMLEALGTSTPVLASDVGSTDYIVGDAGVRFEPDRPRSLVDGFERLVGDYDAHLDAIPDQLSRFAPETVERAFLDLYADAATAQDDRSPLVH